MIDKSMAHRCVAALVVASMGFHLSGPALAQPASDSPDWEELTVAPPATFDADRTVAIELPPHLSMRVGLVPETLRLDADGVVRYVVVATNPAGQRAALFEGIQCARWRAKVYARWSPEAGWRTQTAPIWKDLTTGAAAPHTRALARQGICDGTGNRASVQDMLRALRP